ncbi:hypothetical protein [Staphylococcus phage S6]|nr:hypothetical protein [Staphylococcus phage S6]
MIIAPILLIISVFLIIASLISFVITVINFNEGIVSLIIAVAGGIFFLLSCAFGIMGL